MRQRLSTTIIAACLFLGAAGWVARLFTAKLYYKDDPSMGIVWRAHPSALREIRATHDDPHRAYLVGENENTIVGEWLYDFFVDWAIFLGPAGAVVAVLYRRRSLRRTA